VPCTSLDQLWNTLHSTFNSALDRPIDLSVLCNKWKSPSIRAWVPYSTAEMSDALTGMSNQSAPGPDHITWHHFKCIIQDRYASHLFLWLANACPQSSQWPAEFKASTMVVIPKPGKPLYDTPKLFCQIVLLRKCSPIGLNCSQTWSPPPQPLWRHLSELHQGCWLPPHSHGLGRMACQAQD
jgi:hypothetical protein